MGLGFLAAFGLATLVLLGVAGLIGYGVMIRRRHEDLDSREEWHDNGWLMFALFWGTFLYVWAIVFLALPPSAFG